MKQQLRKVLFVFVCGCLASCAGPKLAPAKTIAPLPEGEMAIVPDSVTLKETPKISSYFSDKKLVQLFEIALASNPDIQIAKERIAIANSYLVRSKKVRLPNLDLELSASGTRFGEYTMEGVGNFDTNLSSNISERQIINTNLTPNFFVGLQSAWEADIWGKLKKLSEAARNRYLATREGERLVRATLFTDIAVLYFELIALDKKLQIYEENYALQQKAYEIIAAQRTIGKATELAVQQFQAQSKNLETEISLLKIEVLEVENALNALLGKYTSRIDRGNTLMTTNSGETKAKELYVRMLFNRPDVLQHYFELQASQADAKAAKAAFLPRLVLGSRFGYNAFSAETLFLPGSLTYQLLGGLFTPLLNRSQLKLEFNVASKEQEIAFWNYQKSVLQAYTELQTLLGKRDIYQKTLTLKAQEVGHLKRAVEVANDLYITGYANYMELINTQKNKLSADLDLLHFELDTTLNTIVLFKALGGSLESSQ